MAHEQPMLSEPLRRAIGDFSEHGRTLLSQLLARGFRGAISATDAQQVAIQARITLDQLLLNLVPIAQTSARVPISGYAVGAVALGGTTGNLYFGSNLEFSGVPPYMVVHAEQSAVNNAWLSGEQSISTLAVSKPPCGHCRQFLFELNTSGTVRILVPDQDPQLLSKLLPQAFGPNELGAAARLMSPEDHQLELETPSADPLLLQALAAANASYAPYTGGYAGAAVRVRGGSIYSGRYAENAAFSPSLSPLASALAMWSLASGEADPIEAATLVQRRSTIDQLIPSRWVLAAVSSAPLQVTRAD